MINKQFVFSLMFGLLGGVAGASLFHFLIEAKPVGVEAIRSQQGPSDSLHETVIAKSIRLVDGKGNRRAELTFGQGESPALFFFDSKGRNRLVLGLYSPGEEELPFVVLNDSNQQAAGIFRLFGASQVPVVVLKNQGQDRSIYGLNPGTQIPFLVNRPADGSKQDIFGSWP